MRVLGIDPGLTRLGFCVVEGSAGGLVALAGGTVSTPASDPTAVRLAAVQAEIAALMDAHAVDEVALERVFYNLNAKTAVPVIQSAGVVMAAAAARGAPVHEYTPPEVKSAVAGSGTAGKEQVGFMVTRLLGEAGATADASDAAAVAICHVHSRRMRAAAGGGAAKGAGSAG